MIGCADPGQNPSAVRSGRYRVRGRGLGRAMVRSVSGAGPAAVMRTRTCHPASGTTIGDASRVRAVPRGGCLAGPEGCRASSHGLAGQVRKPQIDRLFCKPICKPDAAGRRETGETEPTGARRDLSCPPRSPHPRETVRDTGDTCRMAHNPARARILTGAHFALTGPTSTLDSDLTRQRGVSHSNQNEQSCRFS